MTNDLEVPKRLSAFKVAVDTLTDKKRKAAHYFILLLDMKKRRIRTYRFNKSELDRASTFYDNLENKYSRDNDKDLVLVSAQSVKDLKRAYPNYFSDTTEFAKNMKKVYEANKKIN